MRRRVTFSRNVTLSLSRTCRCYCKYCAFATHRPHLHEPDEVLRLIDRAGLSPADLLRPDARAALAGADDGGLVKRLGPLPALCLVASTLFGGIARADEPPGLDAVMKQVDSACQRGAFSEAVDQLGAVLRIGAPAAGACHRPH